MAGVAGDTDDTYVVRSVVKAFSILELFAPETPQLSGADIASLTGLNRATAYRLCQTLTQLGYLDQTESGDYRVGVKALRLARAAVAGQDLTDVARPVLERLRDQLGETVNMAVWDNGDVVYILRLKTDQILNIGLSVGSRLAPHSSSLGKAMLAFFPDSERSEHIAKLDFKGFTDTTIRKAEDLERELATIRRQGFALNRQELAVGLRGVAAPILSPSGRPVAAINVALTRPVTDEELSSTLAEAVMDAAAEIAERAIYAELPVVAS